MRKPKSTEVETLLYEWIRNLDHKVPISDEVIREKGFGFANSLDLNDLKFSAGWIKGFTNRHRLKLRKIHGEEKSSDIDAVLDGIG